MTRKPCSVTQQDFIGVKLDFHDDQNPDISLHPQHPVVVQKTQRRLGDMRNQRRLALKHGVAFTQFIF